MTDLSTIRVIPFSGKADEWTVWNEKFLAKAKRYGFKDLLLGKLSIPKFDESFDEVSDEGKKMLRNAELNEVAYTELILSIDVKSSEGKVAFNLVKGCKTKEYPDGNAVMAWERLKNKYEPVSAPSLVKLEKQFRTLSLKKGEDPEVWITDLEDLRMKLEDMGSTISENQFMIHILNNLTSDYDLQLALLERRVGDLERPLSIEEIKAELNLRFERLNGNSNNGNESKVLEEHALFSGQFKGKCRNCGQIGHKAAQCKKKQSSHVGHNGNMTDGIYCTYCRRTGHVKKNCFKLKKKESQNNNNPGNNDYSNRDRQFSDSNDVAFMSTSEKQVLTDDIWVCDSGACGHYCNSKEGLLNIKEICEEITVGNGRTMTATMVGNLKCKVIQLDGSSLDVTLFEVKYVPELWINLFSLNKALKNGYDLSNKGLSICLSKGPISITFDRVIHTTNGFVSGIKLSIYSSPVAYNATVNADQIKSFNVARFHELLCHCGMDKLQKTAGIHGFKLTGKPEICEDCALAKARQKNVNKEWKGSSKVPGERIYLDISSVRDVSFGGAKFWVLMVDDCTDYCWSLFLKEKSELKIKMMVLLTDLKIAGINIKFIRCDDSGENKAFQQECKSKGWNIIFEYSGPRTPQRNGKVERKFQTFYGRIRATLNCAGLKEKLRSGVWAECARTVTYLSNITALKSKDMCPYQLMFGSKPRLPDNLRSFGEIGVVTTKSDIQGKLRNRGTVCMFLGYSVDHAHDVYRMLNLKTNYVITSRDIQWLKMYHKDWIKRSNQVEGIAHDNDDDNDSDSDITGMIPKVTNSSKSNATLTQLEVKDDNKLKIYRQMKRLESSFNPDASKIIENLEHGRDILLDSVNVALFCGKTINEPQSFDEAWNCNDPDQQQKWRAAIKKEFADMEHRDVWEIIDKDEVPKDRRCIKCKWIFKIKRNGIYRARLVACGYSQVPGVDFNESFAPVINDVSFRVMLIIKLIQGLHGTIIDVETAFLHGNLQEEIFMNIPEGLDSSNDKCLKLKKTIYGLVQSAREFYKSLIEVLKGAGFTENKSDPCLLSKWEDGDVILIGIYVDDCLVIGKENRISILISDLRNAGFNLKITQNLTDYLSCRILENQSHNEILILQPHLINNLREKFEDEVMEKGSYKTPGTPRFKIVRPNGDCELIDGNLQKRFRSGVGMLLYLTKYSRPDLCNIVRELSKCMDGASMGTYLELLRVIKFVLNTKNYCLKISPKFNSSSLNLKVFCDSDWAGDPETRISVTGFIIYLQGAPVCWRSKAQKGVTLSSSEAEYVAISDAVKEIKFLYFLLQDIGIELDLPIVVKTDNIGALFMSQNSSAGVRTRHVDTRYHFIRENIEDGIIKMEFVKSIDNDSDIFTKNVNHEIYEKHAKKFLEKLESGT